MKSIGISNSSGPKQILNGHSVQGNVCLCPALFKKSQDNCNRLLYTLKTKVQEWDKDRLDCDFDNKKIKISLRISIFI
ncbi:hypothetical protein Mgra_00008636 [Meloidogyne graminicola]|uniref:Uncharacterized protein n=1 Tax=Meloidogyne graminicola TaxID=189291 RepID=A0A8S9ZF81_9BILA|nr:hypothetical protein Mgra_00008636 [Meloidogyne graminicola]